MDEVKMWLSSLDLEIYAEFLKKYKYDDMELIRELNDEEVDEMIEAIGCMREQADKIKESIRQINEKEEENFKKMDEVKEWLITLELGTLVKRFQQYKYDDLDMLMSFNDTELEEMFKNIDCKPAQAFTIRNSLAVMAKKREEDALKPDEPEKSSKPLGKYSIDKMKKWPAKKIIKHINKTENFYDVLGVTPDVTPTQLKKAYRTLALKVHPDKLGPDADDDAFKKLDRIYKCLANPIKKEYYDKHEDAPHVDKVGKWICEHCFIKNKPIFKVCRMCQRPRNGAEFTKLLFKLFTVDFTDYDDEKWGMEIDFQADGNWTIEVEKAGQAERLGLYSEDLFLARNGVLLTEENRIEMEELLRRGIGCQMTFRHETEKVKNEKKWAKKDVKTIALRITEGYQKGDRVVMRKMRKNIEKNDMFATILKCKSNGNYNLQLDDGTLQSNCMSKFFKLLPKEEEYARYEKMEKKLEAAKTHGDKMEEVINFLAKFNLTAKDISWKLWKSGIRDRDCRRMGYFLGENSTLTVLRLDDNEIRDKGVQAISNVLHYNKTITELNLSGNKFGDDGAIALGGALKGNSAITKLDTRYNSNIGVKGSQLLANVISKSKIIKYFSGFPIVDLKTSNSCFKEMYQNDTGCGDTEGLVIGLLLRKNSSLVDIRLTSNQITDNGFWLFGKALRKNSVLTKLVLNINEMGDTASANIGVALKFNKTLTELDLSHNKIGNKGAKSIGEALITNAILKELRLANNLIGDVGLKSIAFGLKVNKAVEKIDLNGNNLSDGSADYLVLGLKDNSVIEYVYLQSNTFTAWGKKTVGDVQLGHPTIKLLSI